MREVILASHGKFAEGIEDSAVMIIGQQKNLSEYVSKCKKYFRV